VACKIAYGWPENEHFLVPDAVREHMGKAGENGAKLELKWNGKLSSYEKAHPEAAAEFQRALSGDLPEDWDSGIPVFVPEDGPMATRAASGKVLNAFAQKTKSLIGGSADLAPSTKTLIAGEEYLSGRRPGYRNVAWGIRELAMCACCSGMALHGGIRPYAATFFIFTDYARPAIRLAALMELPVIYVMTHDSIGVGEDGPTHQPIEHLASLRAMPNLTLIRPADANETAYAWRVAMENKSGPTMLVLSRQGLPIFERMDGRDAEGLYKGAYILSREKGARPDVILIASGSEVALVLEAKNALMESGIDARVVSMPSWELFQQQTQEYREEVLPREVRVRLAVEAASPLGWREWVGDGGDILGITRFGASAPGKELFKRYGLTVENVVARARKLLDR